MERIFNRLHLIARNVSTVEDDYLIRLLKDTKYPYTYCTGRWDISAETARDLVGGLVYLHKTKSEPAYIGGIVCGWHASISHDVKRENRISLHFIALYDCRLGEWGAYDNPRDWMHLEKAVSTTAEISLRNRRRMKGQHRRSFKDIDDEMLAWIADQKHEHQVCKFVEQPRPRG